MNTELRELILKLIEKNSRLAIHDLAVMLDVAETEVANEIADKRSVKLSVALCGEGDYLGITLRKCRLYHVKYHISLRHCKWTFSCACSQFHFCSFIISISCSSVGSTSLSRHFFRTSAIAFFLACSVDIFSRA